MEYTIAAYTDMGVCKKSNQDSFCARRAILPEGDELVFAAVCDGMGGLSKGELASAEVIRAFGAWFDGAMGQFPSLVSRDFGAVRSQWESLIIDVHTRLLSYSRSMKIELGTTLVAWLAVGGRYLMVNVGDSRLYEHTGQLCQISQDHSLVAREIALGHITEEQALHHPQRNVLLQCLGAGSAVSPLFREGRVSAGALYLLCTDGFVHKVCRAELEQSLLPMRLGSKESMTGALRDVTEQCKTRGEQDNITAVLVKALESPLPPSSAQGVKSLLHRMMHRRQPSHERQPGAVLVETAQIVYSQEHI